MDVAPLSDDGGKLITPIKGIYKYNCVYGAVLRQSENCHGIVNVTVLNVLIAGSEGVPSFVAANPVLYFPSVIISALPEEAQSNGSHEQPLMQSIAFPDDN